MIDSSTLHAITKLRWNEELSHTNQKSASFINTKNILFSNSHAINNLRSLPHNIPGGTFTYYQIQLSIKVLCINRRYRVLQQYLKWIGQLPLTFLQSDLISPWVPVNGLILPMLIMDWAKATKKAFWLPAKLLTMEIVEEPLVEYNSWSVWRRPLLATRLA